MTDPVILPEEGLSLLVRHLLAEGRQVIAPVAHDGAIVYEPVEDAADIARGWRVTAGPGRYRVTQAGTAWFDHAVGPTPWKRFLHPPRETLYTTRRDSDGITVTPAPEPQQRLALIGVRPCDVAAIRVLDRVMRAGAHPDPRYAARRAACLIVAVQCRVAAETCFCASLGTGPRAEAGFDLALSELGEGPDTRFLIEPGSAAGAALLAELPTRPAAPADLAEARAGWAEAAAAQTRRIDPEGLPSRLRGAAEHPHWDAVGARCLGCTNCTMVCPTCFCTAVEEVSDLDGISTERRQRWDSCFTVDFSHVHGGPVRPSAAARYRQWLTHKLGTWPEQFDGDLGCTGCGRCIAWCPVGIDLTDETAALRVTAS